MNEKFRAASLSLRLVTAVVLAAVLIAAWSMGGRYVVGLVAVLAVAGMGEFLFLFQKEGGWGMKILGLLLGAGYTGACALAPVYAPALAPHLVLAFCAMAAALYALISWSREKSPEPLRRAAVILCGILYIPVLLSPAMQFSRWEQLFVVLLPAASDMAAYFAGVSFGKHPVWPGVSPKKSVEGAVAGLLAAVTVACAMGCFLGKADMLSFALLGAVMGVMAQLGDFFESALKRAVNVKDSSHLLPGHGGVLDRLDSISFCVGTYALASALHPFF
ncbi:phosphatidate cytidylyltransferase [Mailhella massiliensis]|uniref:Phosphatidate cytidylyltransferase n=1 Tax=Mailhella massiliensis TaxID=1903261 RepID=A0A921AXK7_9BACT|nr:phosphatidate cytidylyltransferase [Mailhella massiliensis]HJD98187.1 phosphatidate cytidylyltransferase [Mailhella massiliensis]